MICRLPHYIITLGLRRRYQRGIIRLENRRLLGRCYVMNNIELFMCVFSTWRVGSLRFKNSPLIAYPPLGTARIKGSLDKLSLAVINNIDKIVTHLGKHCERLWTLLGEARCKDSMNYCIHNSHSRLFHRPNK